MAEAQLAFVDAKGGMNASDPPHKIATSQVARMVNCALLDGLPTTRPGCRVIPLEGSSAEFISLAPFQGCIHYNPAKGQGGIQFAPSNSSLALCSGGRKFLIPIAGYRGRAVGKPADITNGCFSNAQLHLAWISQWEDLLIVSDGEGPTFIYDPVSSGARFSLGYNTVDKELSEIPNGATVLTYAHARGLAVVNSRMALVGDNLHNVSLTTSEDLKRFTQQVYWNTGQYFMPPSSMGGINAADILPTQNTVHGHGEIMLHCDDGVFSLNINEAPRSSWSEKPLVKHVLKQCGAAGPYAIALVEGDQYYRSRLGIQTLRSAAANTGLEGSTVNTISPEIDTWLSSDYPRWLRFTSANSWDLERRLLFTCGPIVQGSFRWNRGIVVRNTRPIPTAKSNPIWEGLWTLPPEFSGVIQLVNGIFDGEQRQFAWTRGMDEKTRLTEFSSTFREDVLEDGTKRPIRCQVQTRAVDSGKWWVRREYGNVRIFFRNIAGLVNWGVWYRPGESSGWRFLRAGSLQAPEFDPMTLTPRDPETLAVSIPIGKIPNECTAGGTKSNESRSIQFLVRWEGFITLEGIKVTHGEKDLVSDELDTSLFNIQFSESDGAAYDDFEYCATSGKLW